MKSRIAPLMIALLTCGALMAAGCQSAPEQVQSPAQKPKSVEKTEVGEYGTLKRLNSSAEKRFPAGDRETLGDGYAIGYKVTNSQTGKQEKHFIYAIGDEKSDGLEIVPSERTAPDANSVKRVVKTSDGALQLTHEITWHEDSGRIGIKRTIQKLSKDKLELQFFKFHASSLLIEGNSATATPPSSLSDLARGITGGMRFDCGHQPQAQCTDPTPCPLGPGNCTPFPNSQGRWPPIMIAKQPDASQAEFRSNSIGKSDVMSELRNGYGLNFYWQDGLNLPDKTLESDKPTFAVLYYPAPKLN